MVKYEERNRPTYIFLYRMEAGRGSSYSEKNKSNMRGYAPLQGGTNLPMKTKTSCSMKFIDVDGQQNMTEPDTVSHQCAGNKILSRGQSSAPNFPTVRNPNSHHDVTNTRNSEPGVRHIGRVDKSLGGQDSYQHDATKVPTIEQLEHLTPTKELLLHYRKKILQLNNDYQDLMEKVDQCQSISNLNFQSQKDLERRNSEVSKLQKTVSDLQVYMQQEREQVLRLYSENDRLQIRAAEDHKKIAFLLSLNRMTEHDVLYLSSLPQHRIVPRVERSQFNHNVRDMNGRLKQGTSNNLAGVSGHLDPKGGCEEATALSAQLEERFKIHRNQVLSLLKDREISWKERSVEQKRLGDQVSVLSERLKDTQDQLCDVTKELVKVKKDSGINELNWITEKNRLLQNLELCQEIIGEFYPSASESGNGLKLKSSQQLCAQVDHLKDQLKERDNLVSMYQEQYIQLNEEAAKLREQLDISKKMFREQVQKLAGQVTYLKKKYNDLDRRRKLEAEGFCSDIKILRGRLQDIEKNVKKFFRKQVSPQASYPTNNDLFLAARETRTQSQQLERELRDIKRKVEEIETSIRDCAV
ncbi:coiled-coil domain-containing protein 77-like isoform X2 [Zootermopsis nevadensis]|uniref:coiled-coil domain-containing protein 77-like isoform X2 n=1 Tax=Zootermopsis nevadensis TaxID=136037 RepID=UPI000B8E7EF0|nr:coiled-coil domain-containing protein 77-like isoform X2 [Zootermopsis nevadensis]